MELINTVLLCKDVDPAIATYVDIPRRICLALHTRPLPNDCTMCQHIKMDAFGYITVQSDFASIC